MANRNNAQDHSNVTPVYKPKNSPAPFEEKPFFKNKKDQVQNSKDTAKLLGKIIRDAFTKNANQAKENAKRYSN